MFLSNEQLKFLALCKFLLPAVICHNLNSNDFWELNYHLLFIYEGMIIKDLLGLGGELLSI